MGLLRGMRKMRHALLVVLRCRLVVVLGRQWLLLLLLLGLVLRELVQRGITESHARAAGLHQAVGLSRQSHMAVVRRRKHRVVVVGGAHAVLSWGRSKTARV